MYTPSVPPPPRSETVNIKCYSTLSFTSHGQINYTVYAYIDTLQVSLQHTSFIAQKPQPFMINWSSCLIPNHQPYVKTTSVLYWNWKILLICCPSTPLKKFLVTEIRFVKREGGFPSTRNQKLKPHTYRKPNLNTCSQPPRSPLTSRYSCYSLLSSSLPTDTEPVVYA